MLSELERTRSAERAAFNRRMNDIIKGSWSPTTDIGGPDDVKARISSILFGRGGKFHTSKCKWQKLKDKYPEDAAQLMKEYNKKHRNVQISITMDNYHDDEYLLEEIRKLEGPQGEIVMLERDVEKLTRKIDAYHERIREIGERINELREN